MDDNKYLRGTFAYIPSEFRILNSYAADNKEKWLEGKEGPCSSSSFRDKRCRGDILYLQNPLFNNRSLNSKDDIKNVKPIPLKKNAKHNISDNYFHRLFSWNRNEQNQNISQEVNKKSRKHGMKARAETRRDILINESSDEDYSSINSSSDLKSPIRRHNINSPSSSNMEDSHSGRKSRSARTERYFKRLSHREDNSHDSYDSSVTNRTICAPKRIQEVKFTIRKYEAEPLADTRANIPRDRRSASSFSNQDDNFLSNPVYRTWRNGSPLFCDKNSVRKTTENRTYGGNIECNTSHRSNPGEGAILAYKNNKLPRAFDRLQYIEPQINLDFTNSQKISEQSKPAMNPKRVVRRSYSFQNEIPKEYGNKNDFYLPTLRRAPLAQVSKSGNIDSKNDHVSSAPPMADLRTVDFQFRNLNPRKESREFKFGNKNLTTNYNSASIIPSYTATEEQVSSNNNKKRNSKDLGKELSELEKMYTSLRLSDDNLLERAEERCAEEFTLNKSNNSKNESLKYLSSSSSTDSILEEENCKKVVGEEAHVKNDDMAFRKMQSKKIPALSETQNSLSQISYLLATSSALILDKENECFDFGVKMSKEEPNITKDDVVYRNLHYANNVLKVVEPQPPFGIPLRPATPSTNSNYLSSTPIAVKSPPLKFVPQSEPNLITDDLAFRNLRKDAPKTPPSLHRVDDGNAKEQLSEPFAFLNNNLEETLNDDKFFRKKKKAVRSLSANLYGLIKEVNNLDLNIK